MSAIIKPNSNPVVLLLIDGWGIAEKGEGNAIAQAATPNFNELIAKYPSVSINTVLTGEMVTKKTNIANNYLSLGTGITRPIKNTRSIFDFFDKAGLAWVVITEAERLAYATFFLNGRKKIKREKYRLINSEPTDDYSLEPEMATAKITAEFATMVKSKKYDFISVNLANLNLTAHAGIFSATVKAVEAADIALGKIAKTVLDNSGTLLISAAAGIAESAIEMNTGMNNKKDSSNPVPLIIVGKRFEGKTFGFAEAPNNDLTLVTPAGSLLDIAPTLLHIMNLPIPPEMEGKPLI
jgi:2,3-bisphosphoglycerate-independent phosphoglycerate mutase